MASDVDQFVAEATALANSYCERKRKAAEKRPDTWSDEQEEEYLYGRVCGTTYNTLLDLCDAPKEKYLKACLMAGGRYGKVTVESLELFGVRKNNAAYDQTLRNVLKRLQPLIQEKLQTNLGQSQPGATIQSPRYDARDLLVPDTSAYPPAKALDPKSEALEDYERYWSREPLQVCPSCAQFAQGNVTAAAFPQLSPLGGTVEVFYTGYMRRVKKEGPDQRGVSFCDWCSKWWESIATDSEGTAARQPRTGHHRKHRGDRQAEDPSGLRPHR